MRLPKALKFLHGLHEVEHAQDASRCADLDEVSASCASSLQRFPSLHSPWGWELCADFMHSRRFEPLTSPLPPPWHHLRGSERVLFAKSL